VPEAQQGAFLLRRPALRDGLLLLTEIVAVMSLILPFLKLSINDLADRRIPYYKNNTIKSPI
jgi:hypothetical protein